MPELLKCQCRSFPDIPCYELATQEDLLCDTCRPHCGAAVGVNTDDPRHMKITNWQWSGFSVSARLTRGG